MLSTLTKRAGLPGLLLAGLLLSGCGESLNEATAALPSGRLIGYLPEYRLGSVDLDRLARYYSDLIIFSVEPAKNGGIDMRRLPEARLKVVQQLKQAGVERVLLTVGGGGRSSGFAWACSSAGNRARLISRLRGICLQYGLDGVDYDWEAPRTAGQRAGYDALIIETKQAFATEGLYVTAAVMGSQKLSSAAIRAVDAIHIMAYDARGEHSSFSFATEAVQRLAGSGCSSAEALSGSAFLRPSCRRTPALPAVFAHRCSWGAGRRH